HALSASSFFANLTTPSYLSTLSLHDALPIYPQRDRRTGAQPAAAQHGARRCRRHQFERASARQPHRNPLGDRYVSASAPSQSTSSASAIDSTAPTLSTSQLFSLYPVSISSPRPPAPTKTARVAVPTASTRAVRRPARM